MLSLISPLIVKRWGLDVNLVSFDASFMPLGVEGCALTVEDCRLEVENCMSSGGR